VGGAIGQMPRLHPSRKRIKRDSLSESEGRGQSFIFVYLKGGGNIKELPAKKETAVFLWRARRRLEGVEGLGGRGSEEESNLTALWEVVANEPRTNPGRVRAKWYLLVMWKRNENFGGGKV